MSTPVTDPKAIPPSTSTCMYLSFASQCGRNFAQYPVSAALFPTEAQLDTFITGTILNTDSQVADFATKYACNGENAKNTIDARRYFASYTCSQLVLDAINKLGCPVLSSIPKVGPALCPPKCDAAVASLNQIFADEKSCPAGQKTFERAALQKDMTDFCTFSVKTFDTLGKKCVEGQTNENSTCGFSTQQAQFNGCSYSPNESCCSAFLTANPSAPKTPMSSSSGVSVGTIVGAVIGVLLFLAITVFIFFIQRRRLSPNGGGKDVHVEENDLHKQKQQNQFLQSRQPDMSVRRSVRIGEPQRESTFQSSPQFQSQQQRHSLQIPLTQSSPVITNISSLSPMPPVQNQALSNLSAASSDGISMVVVQEYKALEVDELDLVLGANILMIKAFDDGWALGMDVVTGKQGAFALVCCRKSEQNSMSAAVSAVGSSDVSSVSGVSVALAKRGSSILKPYEIGEIMEKRKTLSNEKKKGENGVAIV